MWLEHDNAFVTSLFLVGSVFVLFLGAYFAGTETGHAMFDRFRDSNNPLSSETFCNDDYDNDADTKVDCLDSDCFQNTRCVPQETTSGGSGSKYRRQTTSQR